METRELGRGGPRVPVVGMGTWQTLDVRGDRDEVVIAALDSGATFLDTSPMYGHAQAVLAHGLRGRRDEAFVADKLWTASDHEAEEQARYALDLYGPWTSTRCTTSSAGARGSTCSSACATRAASA